MAAAWGLRRRGESRARSLQMLFGIQSRKGWWPCLELETLEKPAQGKGQLQVPSALHSAKMEGNRPDVSKVEIGEGEAPLGDQSLL